MDSTMLMWYKTCNLQVNDWFERFIILYCKWTSQLDQVIFNSLNKNERSVYIKLYKIASKAPQAIIKTKLSQRLEQRKGNWLKQ